MTTAGDITDYLLYDYNPSCGFIAVAGSPVVLQSLTLSSSETTVLAPTSTAENTYIEQSYSVYLTFLTAGNYDYGGTFYFKLDSLFEWSGECDFAWKNC